MFPQQQERRCYKHFILFTKIKLKARSSLYWPGIDSELEDTVKSCSLCQEYRNQQQSEPVLRHNIPALPWYKIGTDVFHLFNRHYLLIVDYTTDYFDVSQLPDLESTTVIQHTKAIFAKYGISNEIMSENGPEFNPTPRILLPTITNTSPAHQVKATPSSPPTPNQQPCNLPQRQTGVSVRLHDGKCWSTIGHITFKVPQPHSYMVLTETGHTVRRNRTHPLQTREDSSPAEYDSDISPVSTPTAVAPPDDFQPQDTNHDLGTTEPTIAEPMPANEDLHTTWKTTFG